MFTRREQTRTRVNRWLRDKSGLIIPMPIPLHDELHKEVEPPIVPSPRLARDLIHTTDDLDSVLERLGYLQERASAKISEEAALLLGNLALQKQIIQEGTQYG